MPLDMTFDADLDLGEYTDDTQSGTKPHLLAIRLRNPKVPFKLEFTTGDAMALDGWIAEFTRQAAKMRACPANAVLEGTTQIARTPEEIAAAIAGEEAATEGNTVGALPNSPATAGEGVDE